MPAILGQLNQLGSTYSHGTNLKLNCVGIQNDFRALEEIYSKLQTKIDYLNKFIDATDNEGDSYEKAYKAATKGVDLLQSLRDDVDQAEALVSKEIWPLPSYDDLLLSI